MGSTQQTGQRGEQRAADFLRQKGYTIVATNWRCRAGELDIVAKQGETLVFVEVRTRSTVEDAFMSITPAKQKKLIRTLYVYLDMNNLEDCDWRLDVIAVTRGGSIEHGENAFDW